MKNVFRFPLFSCTLIALLLFSASVFSQEKASKKEVKINIIKKENGETTTINKVITTDHENELRDILKEYGIEPDLEDLDENEEIQIVVKKKKGDDQDEKVVELMRPPHGDFAQSKAFLGIYFDQPSAEKASELQLPGTDGVLISSVVEESAAQKAGLKEGDFITKIEDKEIHDGSEFRATIASYEPGDEVKLTYIRDGKEESVKATLGERKMAMGFPVMPGDLSWMGPCPHAFGRCGMEGNNQPFLGIAPQFDEANKQEDGLVVGKVIENSTAAEIGLQKGDVIKKVNDEPVKSIDEIRTAMDKTKIGETVKVEFERDGKKMEETATVKSRPDNFMCNLDWCGDKMERCIEKMNRRIEEGIDMDKEAMKENIEKAMEKMQLQLDKLKMELENLDQAGPDKENESVEKEVVITMENVSDEKAQELNNASKTSSSGKLEISSLTFSPNPNDGRFSLRFDLPTKGQTVIRIYDMSNKEVYSETLNKFSGHYDNPLDISENPKGIYFLQISQGNKVFNKKIVIQ